MSYSRQTPSPEYIKSVELGKIFHATKKVFSGRHCFQSFPLLKQLIVKFDTHSILDYGIGKGENLTYRDIHLLNHADDKVKQVYPSWIEALGVDEYVGYDPCVPQFEHLPERQFDAVISTDVVGHIPIPDLIHWVIPEIFAKARQWVYVAIACFPGKKILPDGSRAYKTIEPPAFWVYTFNEIAKRYPEILWEIRAEQAVSPLTHRRFSGQAGEWSEGVPWWAFFKPDQLEHLTEKQRIEMLQAERSIILPLTQYDLRQHANRY